LPFPIKTTDSTSGRGTSGFAEAAPGQRLVETLAKIARHEPVDQGVDAAARTRVNRVSRPQGQGVKVWHANPSTRACDISTGNSPGDVRSSLSEKASQIDIQ
jgi:hypothetical protein